MRKEEVLITCVSCRLGRLWECQEHGKCNDGNFQSVQLSNAVSPDPNGDSDSERDSEEGPVREINTYKSDAALRDQQSTGRKRAAEMYPLDRDADCEWKLQKNCGGGSNPIVGCLEGKQQARHHGPDKNTLNNDYGNVHRICHQCHNRWHARNDEGYVWGAVYNNHSPISCSQEEVMAAEIQWIGKKLKAVVD